MNESQCDKYQREKLENLLVKYEDVFQEVHTLPPSRNYDRKIVLIGGTNTINVRPDRYPSFQKNIMENYRDVGKRNC